MNLRQIRYFCEVVDAGGTVDAAKHLFVRIPPSACRLP